MIQKSFTSHTLRNHKRPLSPISSNHRGSSQADENPESRKKTKPFCSTFVQSIHKTAHRTKPQNNERKIFSLDCACYGRLEKYFLMKPSLTELVLEAKNRPLEFFIIS